MAAETLAGGTFVNVLLTAVFLSLATASASFPPPTVVALDDNLKFSSGPLASINGSEKTLVQTTPAGPVTFHVGQAQVIGPNKQAVSISSLRPGQQLRVYFRVAQGANALEIDVDG